LELTDDSFEGETPPQSHGAKEEKKIIDVECSMMVGTKAGVGMNMLEVPNVVDEIISIPHRTVVGR
jgi:hypothetical protein